MKYIVIQDTEDQVVAIPIDNIAYVKQYEGATRVYLRQVAITGSHPLSWYIITHLPVDEVMRRISTEST